MLFVIGGEETQDPRLEDPREEEESLWAARRFLSCVLCLAVLSLRLEVVVFPGETGPAGVNNSWGKAEWGGPAPPSGTHHYVFKLYALKEPVSLKPGANAKALETAIRWKILAEAKLVGLFSAAR